MLVILIPSMPSIRLTRLGCELSNFFVLQIELCESRSHPGLKLVGSLMVRCLPMYVLQSSDLVERELQAPRVLLMDTPQLLYCIAVHCISWACGMRISGPPGPAMYVLQAVYCIANYCISWGREVGCALGYLVLSMSVLQALYLVLYVPLKLNTSLTNTLLNSVALGLAKHAGCFFQRLQ